MESNIRLIKHGNALFLKARKVSISRIGLSPDQLQTICTILKNRKIASTPYIDNGVAYLITEYRDEIRNVFINITSSENKDTELEIILNSVGDELTLELANKSDRRIIEDLYIKRGQINILGNADLRIINKSPNVYYDKTPIATDEDLESDIVAYQRYFVFTEYFEGKGLGFGVDVGTSYFTRDSVEKYFSSGNEKRFFELKERQSTEYKGTLLYKGPNGTSRCYFDRYDGITTLAKTDAFTFKGTQYKNSYDYFKKLYPSFDVNETDKVAYVSFKGMGTYPVPAKFLFLTVSTENLTDDINQQDKYSAQQKKNLIDAFWKRVSDPFGRYFQQLADTYYSPSYSDGGIFDMPTINYANEQQLLRPKHKNSYLYKKYFLNKYYKLKDNGCYYVPPMLEREIHFVMPRSGNNNINKKLIEDLTKEATILTQKSIEPIDHSYEKGEHLAAIYDLKNNYEIGTVVFVFDSNDPSIYFNISQELKGWKIVRLTKQELTRKFNKLQSHPKGKSYWETYISLNAFKIVTELGCVPYMFNEELSYPAQLVIDVSENFSHFGLGLLVYNRNMRHPIFDYIIKPNPDGRNDLINPLMLEKYLTELLIKYLGDFNKYGIDKILVLRDGKENKKEYDVFVKVINDLKSYQKNRTISLQDNFDYLFIDYRKKSSKSIRLFENNNGVVQNPLEGSWMRINKSSAILANTGTGTLTQGTSSPILIKSNYREVDLIPVLRDIFLTSQLNFGSPRVAQKLTYLAKRIDDLLKERRAQEVTKIK